MLQARALKVGELVVEEVPEPQYGPRDVLLAVDSCGICGTDRYIFTGDYPVRFPIVLGHEFAGTVVAIGSEVETLAVGDRVTVDPNVFCGTCAFCRRGLVNLCTRLDPLGITQSGGYAQYTAVPERNAYLLTDTVSFHSAALIEPLSCCVRGMEVAGIQRGDTVVVLGAGPMGCMLTQLIRLEGASRIIVSEPNAARRALALSLGADLAVDSGEPVREQVTEATDGLGADVVFEAAGRAITAELALDLVRRGGTVVWFGSCPEADRLSISPFWVNDNEITIRGSFNNPNTHSTALNLVARGRVDLDALVTDVTSLTGLERALDLANFPHAGKIIVEPRH